MRLIASATTQGQSEFLGRKATDEDYDRLVDEDAEIVREDGSLLCILKKKSLSREASAKAWTVLSKMNPVSRNRGLASGEDREAYIRKDGAVSNTHIAEPVNSGIIGFFERTPRFPYCRACAWNLHDPAGWEDLNPLIREVDALFKANAPARYELQARVAKKSHPDFLIPGTHFSTLTVNKNFRTAYHRDAGNLEGGTSCMTVFRQGRWTGANLVFPVYRVAVKLDSFDTIIFDPYEIHGNTPLIQLTPNAVRCSVVYYFRDKIQHCRSAAEELEIVKNRRQGEQMFKTIIRKKAPNVSEGP